jgi:hypothetical protein
MPRRRTAKTSVPSPVPRSTGRFSIYTGAKSTDEGGKDPKVLVRRSCNPIGG